MTYSVCDRTIRLAKRTNCTSAKTLHAMLRYYPGYGVARESPQLVNWAIQSLCAIAEERPDLFCKYLPQGCISAVYLLADALPFAPAFREELSLDGVCLLVIHLANYCRFVGEINPEFFA